MSGSAVKTLSTYLDRVTSEHATQPDFIAYLTALLQPLIDAQNQLRDLLNIYDLDTAVGVQLDAVGVWVGRSRFISTPLAGVYFSFDTPGLGFDQGSWQGQFDPIEGITSLDDSTYRDLLRAKIIINGWDGTLTEAAEAIGAMMKGSPGSNVFLVDNQDMTMTVGISGVIPPAITIALLQGGYIPINPEGVLVNYLVTSLNDTGLFGFDINDPGFIEGFDIGAWAGPAGVGPGPPSGFALVSFTQNSATFTWLNPTTGSGPFTFQLEYQLGPGTSSYTLYGSPINGNSITAIGLANGQQYTFTVYAINATGPSAPAIPITFTTQFAAQQTMTGRSSFGQVRPSALITNANLVRAAITLPLSAAAAAASGSGIVINPITNALNGSQFVVTGSLLGFNSAPTLTYADDASLAPVSGITESATTTTITLGWSAETPVAFQVFPGGSTVTSTTFSFTHPAMTAGTHTLTVSSGTYAATVTYTVV